MSRFRKKQKILYIVAAALFALLGLGLLFALLTRPANGSEGPAPEASSAPAATAAPARNTISVAGKDVEAETDSFDLSGRALSDQDKAEIAGLKNLTTLSLTNCSLTDVSFLSSLTSLRTLYLPDNRINDLSPLSSLTELRTVYLDRNPLTDLTPLTKIPGLSMLSIQGVTIADYVLADLQAAMPNCRIFSDSVVEEARPISLGGVAFTEDVEVLDLSDRRLTDISKLSYCLQLRDLNLSGNQIDNYSVLSGLPKLTVLTLCNADVTDDQLEFFATLERLTYLDLRENIMLTAEGLEKLEKALPDCQVFHDTVFYSVPIGGRILTSDAQEIDLSAAGLTDLQGLEKFTMLRRLGIHGNGVTDLAPLTELMTLEELDAGYNNLKDITPLAGHTAMRKLDLSHNGIESVAALSECAMLEELDLSYNALTELTPLYGCTALKQLDLTGNPAVTADQIRKLQEALPGCTIVTDTDLSMPEPTPPPPPEEDEREEAPESASPTPEAGPENTAPAQEPVAENASSAPESIPEYPAPIPEYPENMPEGTAAP